MIYWERLVPAATRTAVWGRTSGAQDKRSISVLIVEDDGAIADMYRMQLEHDGYLVNLASTAEIGLREITATPPDIVLLDLLLPDRSGFDLMAMLSAQFPSHPPIVILSNYGEPAMVNQGLALGAVEYLVKSRVTPSLVSRSIPGWIEQNRKKPKN